MTSTSAHSNGVIRFSRGRKCPVCGGCDDDPRGQGQRCHGYLSGDRKIVFCSREEHAGSARHDEGSRCYIHSAKGNCPCGVEHAPADQRTRSARQIDHVYRYHGPDGTVLFEVVRYRDPKDFRQRRSIGNGKFAWNLQGIEPVLYHLPQISTALADTTIWIVEGEKDADALGARGLVATTNPMGAGKWRDQYAEALKGRRVVIIPDNDQAGRDHAQQVAQSLCGTVASVKVLALPGLPEKGDVSDFLASGGTLQQLAELAAATAEWTPSAASPAETAAGPERRPSRSKRESPSDVLLRIADRITPFRDDSGSTYAEVPVNGHHETYSTDSKVLRQWLTKGYYKEEGEPPSQGALENVLGILEARATFEGQEQPVFFRVANHAGRTYLDLGDQSWRAVEIDATGWRVASKPPVKFHRSRYMRALPEPVRGGSIDEFKEFVNVSSDEMILFVAWLAASFRAAGPYPILVLNGEQGSAKSTLARLARSFIDPHKSLLRCEPKDVRDLMVAAVNNWVVALDNISKIFPWLSDALCRVSTGGGFASRALYSNNEESIMDATRPVILTGITDFVASGDLVDRSLFLHLTPIPESKRKTEAVFWEKANAAMPRLLGALLDAVSCGLRLLPEVEASITSLPRMADFAVFGEAVSRATGIPDGRFLEIYRDNRLNASETIVEDSPVASSVERLMRSRDRWIGTAEDLLRELTSIVEAKVADSPFWPRTPRAMSGHARRLAPALRMLGINAVFDVRDGTKTNRRLILLESLPSNPETPSEPSEPY